MVFEKRLPQGGESSAKDLGKRRGKKGVPRLQCRLLAERLHPRQAAQLQGGKSCIPSTSCPDPDVWSSHQLPPGTLSALFRLTGSCPCPNS